MDHFYKNNLIKHIRLDERKYTKLIMVLSRLKSSFVLAAAAAAAGMVGVKGRERTQEEVNAGILRARQLTMAGRLLR